MSALVEFVLRDPEPQVLAVTNMWPEPDRPVYGIFVQRQIESLRRAGVTFDVLYVRGYASPRAYAEASLLLLRSSFAWRGRYSLVHAHAAESALAARFHVGTPMIVSYVGDDVLGDRDETGRLTRNGRARSAFVRAHARLFPATITKSKVMEDALPPRVRRRNHVIPNGVDRMLFKPADRAAARAVLGWGDEPVALFACTKTGSAAKRLPLAERATSEAGVRLHVASGVAPDEMPLLMAASDCLLVTSAVEGSPNTVKEALSCNLPVIATPVGDIPERLEGVTPSWLCPPDATALATALRDCARRGERSNGCEHTNELDERRVAARMLELYARFGVEPVIG